MGSRAITISPCVENDKVVLLGQNDFICIFPKSADKDNTGIIYNIVFTVLDICRNEVLAKNDFDLWFVYDMKNTFLIFVSIFFVFTVGIQAKTRIVEKPPYVYSSTTILAIHRVTLTDTDTLVAIDVSLWAATKVCFVSRSVMSSCL